MRRIVQTLASSDPWLAGLVVGLLAVAGLCRIFMAEASPIPEDKTVLTLCKGGFKRDREEMKEIRAAFHARHPDLYLQVIQSVLERKQDTMIAAGTPPDLIFVMCDRADYYITGDALLDLMPYVKRDPELHAALFGGPDGSPPDFYPQMIEPFMKDGRLYAVPVNYTPFLIYYSKDLFDRYRVAYPDSNWTWDDLLEKATALTRDSQGRRPDQPGFNRNDVVTYGFNYAKWQHGVETFIRQSGGRLVNEAGTRVVADDPRTIRALRFLYDMKYKYGVSPPGQNPLRQNIGLSRGTLGMDLTGVFAIPTLREQAPNIDWDIAPLPRGPEGRRASIVFSNAYGVSRDTKHPEAAIRLLKFMVSAEAMSIVGKHQVFLPARRSVLKRTMVENRSLKPRSTWALTHDLDHGYAHAPFSTKQNYADVYEAINDELDRLLALQHAPDDPYTPEEAARNMARIGNSILERDRLVKEPSPFGWLAVGIAALPAVYLLVRFARRPKRAMSRLALNEERWGYALISPWLLGFFVFAAFPILVSIVLSFARWQSLSEFSKAEFIGIENYRVALAAVDPKFYTSLWVTFRYALLAVPAGLFAGLALAILMNQRLRGIAVFRTLYYIPAILPSVATAVLWWHLFDVNTGWVNRFLSWVNFNGWVYALADAIDERFPFAWLESPTLTPYVFVVMSLWIVGGGMIIYLAGLQSIPTQLYEAAEIDGAGRWAQLRFVTIPMLTPVIFFNLVMGIIASFQVFNVAFVLFEGGTGPNDSALFYGLHLFREAFMKYRLGYASALAWILFLIILVFTALVFKSSPMWVHYEAGKAKRA